jgi:hypothetical protein
MLSAIDLCGGSFKLREDGGLPDRILRVDLTTTRLPLVRFVLGELDGDETQ